MLERRYNYKTAAINTDILVVGCYKNTFDEISLYSVEHLKKIINCSRYQMYFMKADIVVKTTSVF